MNSPAGSPPASARPPSRWQRFRSRLLGGGAALMLGFAAVFGLITPLLTPVPTVAAQPLTVAEPDFSGYQELLNEYLSVITPKGAPLDTRFDYEKLYDARGRYERMARIKRQMLQVPPAEMDPPTRLAWAINLYNFTVIDRATDNLLVPERGRLRYKSVRDIDIARGGFFGGPAIEVDGKEYSLDQFEREFAFAGFARGVEGDPPATLDPRVHFALVCGAIGCPPLQPRAFRGDSLERQLDAVTRGALALPRHLRINEKINRLEVSSLFQWYDRDFGGREKAFVFLNKYAPAKLRKEIETRGYTSLGGIIPWDWALNQTERKKEI